MENQLEKNENGNKIPWGKEPLGKIQWRSIRI